MSRRHHSPEIRAAALCVGRHDLFDSTQLADHKRAAEFCAVCPVRPACAERLATARREQTIAGYGPEGTWAGRLLRSTKGAALWTH